MLRLIKANWIFAYVVLTFLVVPYTIGSTTCKAYILFSFLIFFVAVQRKYFLSFVIPLTIVLCLPSGLGAADVEIFVFTSTRLLFIKCFQYIVPAIFFLFLLQGRWKSFPHKVIVVPMVMFFLCVVFSTIVQSSEKEFIYGLLVFGLTYAIFFMVAECRPQYETLFKVFDLLFFLTFVYVVMEFIFHVGPYQKYYAYLVHSNVEYLGRAKGLLGHPLFLSFFVLFYQVVLFSRYMMLKKGNTLGQFFCFICVLFTVSRTTILGETVLFTLFFVLGWGFKNKKIAIIMVISVVLAIVAYSLSKDQFTLLLNRLEYAGASHRFAAWKTSYNLFLDNWLGVGHSNIMQQIKNGGYAAQGFSANFTTLDNFFLSQFCAYGLMALLPIVYFFYIPLLAYKKRMWIPLEFKVSIMLFVLIFLTSFSFCWESAPLVNLLSFSFFGILLSKDKFLNIESKGALK